MAGGLARDGAQPHAGTGGLVSFNEQHSSGLQRDAQGLKVVPDRHGSAGFEIPNCGQAELRLRREAILRPVQQPARGAACLWCQHVPKIAQQRFCVNITKNVIDMTLSVVYNENRYADIGAAQPAPSCEQVSPFRQ